MLSHVGCVVLSLRHASQQCFWAYMQFSRRIPVVLEAMKKTNL